MLKWKESVVVGCNCERGTALPTANGVQTLPRLWVYLTHLVIFRSGWIPWIQYDSDTDELKKFQLVLSVRECVVMEWWCVWCTVLVWWADVVGLAAVDSVGRHACIARVFCVHLSTLGSWCLSVCLYYVALAIPMHYVT